MSRAAAEPRRDGRHRIPAWLLAALLVACGNGSTPNDIDADADADVGDADADAGRDGDLDSGEDADADDTPDCPVFSDGESLGQVSAAEVIEASGLVASGRNPGVLWTHNDSGGSARLFALTTGGELLGEWEVLDAEAYDWEEVAIGPGMELGAPWLFVADIGDNYLARSEVQIYRAPEPEVDAATGGSGTVTAARFDITYPDGPHDAETLLVDPTASGALYIVTKHLTGPAAVFFVELPDSPPSDPIEAVRVATVDVGWATGGTVSRAGTEVVIRNEIEASLWLRDLDRPLASAFDRARCPLPLREEEQGEAIAFASDDSGYYTVGEGTAPDLFWFSRE